MEIVATVTLVLKIAVNCSLDNLEQFLRLTLPSIVLADRLYSSSIYYTVGRVWTKQSFSNRSLATVPVELSPLPRHVLDVCWSFIR